MTRARLVSAAVFAATGAVLGGGASGLFLWALSSSPQTTIISFEMEPAEIAAGAVAGAACLAIPWALAGALLAPRLATARPVGVLGLGTFVALVVTVLGVCTPLTLAFGVADTGEWIRASAAVFLVLIPFAVVSSFAARRLVRRGAPDDPT